MIISCLMKRRSTDEIDRKWCLPKAMSTHQMWASRKRLKVNGQCLSPNYLNEGSKSQWFQIENMCIHAKR